MMFVEVLDIDPLVNFFDVIYNDSVEVNLKFSPENLKISLLNKGNVSFYNLEIGKDFFGEYLVDEVEEIPVYVEDLYKILKSATKDDVLYLESNENYLICRFEHDNNRRVFELPISYDYTDIPTMPAIDYEGTFDILIDDIRQPSIDLDKIVKTNKFKIRTSESMMNIVAPLDAMTKYIQQVHIDSDVECVVIVDNKYIRELYKLSKINKVVTLSIGNSMPLSWNIISPDKLVSVTGLIAPIIEEE